MAGLLCALGATVIGYDRYVSPEAAARVGVHWVPLEELLRTSDVVSFHLPVTDETKRMFGARELGWIKDGAVFVNSARNAIFDDAALVAEIQKQRFTAYLDVFEVEPLPLDHPYRVAAECVHHTAHRRGQHGDVPALWAPGHRSAARSPDQLWLLAQSACAIRMV